MKKMIRLLALLLALALLTGCGASAKTFTCKELSIEIPSYMRDVSGQSEFSAFTFALDSSKIAVFGLNETFADYPVLEEYNTQDYAELVISSHGLSGTVSQRGNYHYIVYAAETEAGEYTYVAGIFRNDNGFWMVQVCSLTENYNEEAFLGYLDTVTVG